LIICQKPGAPWILELTFLGCCSIFLFALSSIFQLAPASGRRCLTLLCWSKKGAAPVTSLEHGITRGLRHHPRSTTWIVHKEGVAPCQQCVRPPHEKSCDPIVVGAEQKQWARDWKPIGSFLSTGALFFLENAKRSHQHSRQTSLLQ